MSGGRDDRRRRAARGRRASEPAPETGGTDAAGRQSPRSKGADKPARSAPEQPAKRKPGRKRGGKAPAAPGDTARSTHASTDTDAQKSAANPATVFEVLRARFGWSFDRPLGDGGFGYVYAIDVGNVPRAVKISKQRIGPKDSHSFRELQAIKETQGHPRLLHLVQYGIVEGHLITVWECAECTLEDKLREHQRVTGEQGLPLRTTVRWIREAAEAIDFLNQRGIYHRDIKPQNLFLLHGHVKVGDMGLVKFAGMTTTSQSFAGTLGYLPPEAWDRTLHRSIDIFGLAATYVRLRTGRLPFGETMQEILHRTRHGQFERAGLSRAEIACLEQALDPDPHQRPDSAVAWVRRLTRELKREQTGLATRLWQGLCGLLGRLFRIISSALADERTATSGQLKAPRAARHAIDGDGHKGPVPDGAPPHPPAPAVVYPPPQDPGGAAPFAGEPVSPPAARGGPGGPRGPAHHRWPTPPVPQGPPPVERRRRATYPRSSDASTRRRRRLPRFGFRTLLLLVLAALIGGAVYHALTSPLPFVFPPPPEPAVFSLSYTASVNVVPILCARFSPDGRHIVTGAADGTVCIWDARTAQRQAVLKGHRGPVTCVRFFSDGRRVLSASADMTARVWDVESPQEPVRFEAHKDEVLWGTVDLEGQHVVTVSESGGSYVWDARTGEITAKLATQSAVFAEFGTIGTRIVVIHPDETSGAVLQADTGEVRTSFSLPMRGSGPYDWKLLAAFLVNDDGVVLGIDSYGGVIRWDASTGEQLAFLPEALRKKEQNSTFICACLSQDQSTVAAVFDGPGGAGPCLWDVKTETICRWEPSLYDEFWHFNRAHCDLAPDGRRFVVARGCLYLDDRAGIRPAVNCYQFEGDSWLAVTRQGFFTGSKDAPEFIHHTDARGNTLPAEESRRYFRPDVVRRLIANSSALPIPQK